MARFKKSPDERRREIVDKAQYLFSSKGIAETSVSDIVKAVGLSQGAFYWYFPSKEAVLNAVVERMADAVCDKIGDITSRTETTALEKLALIRRALFDKGAAKDKLIEYYHRPDNKRFHDYLIQAVTRRLIPVFSDLIQEGVSQKIWKTDFPNEVATFVVVSLQSLHEDALFNPAGPMERRVEALFDFMLKGLECAREPAAGSTA